MVKIHICVPHALEKICMNNELRHLNCFASQAQKQNMCFAQKAPKHPHTCMFDHVCGKLSQVQKIMDIIESIICGP